MKAPQPRAAAAHVKHWPLDADRCICGWVNSDPSSGGDSEAAERLYAHVAHSTKNWFSMMLNGQRRRKVQGEAVGPARVDCLTSQAIPGHYLTYWKVYGAWPELPNWTGVQCSCGEFWPFTCQNRLKGDLPVITYGPRTAAAMHRRDVLARKLRLNAAQQQVLDEWVRFDSHWQKQQEKQGAE